jgi:hypothetical protein
MNIEHPTSNFQRRMWFISYEYPVFLGIQLKAAGKRSKFDVGRWMFDVRGFFSLQFLGLWVL